jgi:2-oxoglutarate ferredoxin oxidoreductase subunit alpha
MPWKKPDVNPYSHLNMGMIKVNSVWPFPEEEIRRLAKNCKYVFVPEMNVGKYVREVDRCLKNSKVISLRKLGGDLHTPTEILESIAREVEQHE